MEGKLSYVLLITTYIIQKIYCDAWTYESEIIHNQVAQINSNGTLNTSLVFNIIKPINLIECGIVCNRDSALSFYFVAKESTCYCNSAIDPYVDQTVSETGVTYGYSTFSLQMYKYMDFVKRHHQPEPIDCKELFNIGYREDGVYSIRPGDKFNTDVWCDMTKGGWTVIQNRQDGTETFNKTWTEYVRGFGNRTAEYWLGLEAIRLLVEIPSMLVIDMETFADTPPIEGFAIYNEFAIDDDDGDYKLMISGFQGNVDDSLSSHNGQMFTTRDKDNDILDDVNCAGMFSGGWWYRNCHESNLNGEYTNMNPTEYGHGIVWSTGWGFHYSLSKTTMKVIRT